MMLNTSDIWWLKWLSDKFSTTPLNMPANPYGHLPIVSRNPQLYQKGRLGNLPKMPRNPWPFADKTWTIYQEHWQILGQFCKNSRGSAKNTDKFLAICREICQERQQILGHLPRLPRTAIKICLPRMLTLPWLALAAGSFGSLGSR